MKAFRGTLGFLGCLILVGCQGSQEAAFSDRSPSPASSSSQWAASDSSDDGIVVRASDAVSAVQRGQIASDIEEKSDEQMDDVKELETTKDELTDADAPTQSPGQSPYQGVFESDQVIQVSDISYHGEGCPADSVAMNISDDQQAFTILFSEFYVEAFEKSKSPIETSCTMTMTLDIPHGYQVSVLGTDLRGFADLVEQQTATIASRYEMNNDATAGFEDTIEGPTGVGGDFEFHHDLDVESLVWSACGASYELALEVSMAIDNSQAGGTAYVAMDSLDGEFMHKTGLAWRQCD